MLYLSKVFPADFAPYARDKKTAPYAIVKLMPISEPSLPRKGAKQTRRGKMMATYLRRRQSGPHARGSVRKGGPDRVP